MSEDIKTEKDFTQALCALWEDYDEKIDTLREEFKRDVLRDLMELVIAKRDTNNEPNYFQKWFGARMAEAAYAMVRTDLYQGKTQQQCLVELWEALAEEIGDLVPAEERGAWFAQATDDGGWIEFDEGLVQKAA